MSRVSSDKEDRVFRGDRLEIRRRGGWIDGEMGASPRCQLQVAAKDRRAPTHLDFLKPYLFASTVAKDGVTTGSPDVGHPIRALTEHGDEVALALVVGDDDRERDQSAAAATANLKAVQSLWPFPRCGSPAPEAIQEPRNPVWTPALVEPGSERTQHRLRLSAAGLLLWTSSGGSASHGNQQLGRDTAFAMSEENVELAERAAEMFNNRNLHGFLALMAPDVRFQPQLGPSSDGHDGIRRLWDSLIEGGDLTVEVVDVRDLGGDSVLAAVREHGRSTATGMSFHQTVWVPSSWRQGECVWWGVFFGEQDAIAAAGVGNSALDEEQT